MDSEGNWIPGSSSTLEKDCRAEINSTNGLIDAADGTQINYDWIVYMPLPGTVIAPGTMVEVKNGDTVLCKDKVKQYSQGQLNQRIWL